MQTLLAPIVRGLVGGFITVAAVNLILSVDCGLVQLFSNGKRKCGMCEFVKRATDDAAAVNRSDEPGSPTNAPSPQEPSVSGLLPVQEDRHGDNRSVCGEECNGVD